VCWSPAQIADVSKTVQLLLFHSFFPYRDAAYISVCRDINVHCLATRLALTDLHANL